MKADAQVMRESASKLRKFLMLGGAMMLATVGFGAGAHAQTLSDLKNSKPLTIKARGSFYVGGQNVDRTFAQLGDWGTPDTSPSIRCTWIS